MRWQLRDRLFEGARAYSIDYTAIDGSPRHLRIDVDKNGFFETNGYPDLPLGVFAKRIEREEIAIFQRSHPQ